MMSKNQWRKGPVESIECTPSHDRPVFSLAIGQSKFVTGSADHGLREYKLDSGKYIRELFGKKYGHKEWVSCCTYTPSGRILSGAMDSVVCYWQSKSVKCDHFLGHQGSISKVIGDDRLGISASYDATIMLWDLARKKACQTLIGPHKEAIMQIQWHNSLLVSGDKTGVVAFWDLNKCAVVKAVKTHKGSVCNMQMNQKNGILLATGLNDGCLSAFDMRSNQAIYREMLHKGSVNWLKIIEDKNLVVTCSADGSIKVMTLPDFQKVITIDAKDMLFTVDQAYGVLIAGSSKGNILAYDITSGQSLYGYGVMKKGGCRLIGINKEKNRLVCAGQDNSATLLQY